MKKIIDHIKNNRYAQIFLAAFLLWLCFLILTIIVFYCDGHNAIDGDAFSLGNVVFVAVGALFTGLAFAGTVCTLFYQEKNRVKTTTLTVFLDAFQKIQTNEVFNKSKSFIQNKLDYSYRSLQKKYPNESIGIDKFKENYKGEDHENPIIFFGSTMEYIGAFVANDYMSKQVLFDYWGQIIIDTFEKIYKLYEKDKFPFPHYMYLYTEARKHEYEGKFQNKVQKWKEEFELLEMPIKSND